MTAILRAQNIIVKRNKKTVLSIDQISIENGEILAVIGPNGAGKSTLLMALSTLLPVTEGRIFFEEKPFQAQNKLQFRRQIGMVLQDPLLLDTSVSENIGTGMRFRGIKESIIKKEVAIWAENLSISHLLNRKSKQLSGGEAQRVSLARAMALKPKILFLDEPFSALDSPTRVKLITDFQRVQHENRVTTLFVTHNLDEALVLADRVTIIMAGEIRQVGTPHEVFTSPTDHEVAQFVGVESIIPGVVTSWKEGLASIKVNGYIVDVVGEAQISQPVFVCLRPEDITISTDTGSPNSSARNHLFGRIDSMTPQGPLERIVIDCGFPLVALITRTSAKEMQLVTGQRIQASFKASTAHLVNRLDKNPEII
jgi:tungstate transport system ATP-binding protein